MYVRTYSYSSSRLSRVALRELTFDTCILQRRSACVGLFAEGSLINVQTVGAVAAVS